MFGIETTYAGQERKKQIDTSFYVEKDGGTYAHLRVFREDKPCSRPPSL
jgi:hypothetical protein